MDHEAYRDRLKSTFQDVLGSQYMDSNDLKQTLMYCGCLGGDQTAQHFPGYAHGQPINVDEFIDWITLRQPTGSSTDCFPLDETMRPSVHSPPPPPPAPRPLDGVSHSTERAALSHPSIALLSNHLVDVLGEARSLLKECRETRGEPQRSLTALSGLNNDFNEGRFMTQTPSPFSRLRSDLAEIPSLTTLLQAALHGLASPQQAQDASPTQQSAKCPSEAESTDAAKKATDLSSPSENFNATGPALARSATSTGPKYQVVISYSTKQTRFMRMLKDEIQKLGLGAWSGEDVQGGQNWIPQWMAEAKKDTTVGFVFLLSPAFVKSPACTNEFQYVIQNLTGRKSVFPLMYEAFDLPDEIMFQLTNVNLEWITPRSLEGQDVPGPGKTDKDYIRMVDPLFWSDYFPSSLYRSLQKFLPIDFHPQVNGALVEEPSENEQQNKFLKLLDEVAPESVDLKTRFCLLLQAEIQKKAGLEKISDNMVGGRIAIIGGTTFFSPISEAICKSIGRHLGRGNQINAPLITGGLKGVALAVTRAYCEERKKRELLQDAFMLMPIWDPDIETKYMVHTPIVKGGKAESPVAPTQICEKDGKHIFKEWDHGHTVLLDCGSFTPINANLVSGVAAVILVEGGPGALKQALASKKEGNVVIPVPSTNGSADNNLLKRDNPFTLSQHEEKVFEDVLESHELEVWHRAHDAWVELVDRKEDDPEKVGEYVLRIVEGAIGKGVHEKKEANQKIVGSGREEFKPEGLRELYSLKEVADYMKEFEAVFQFSGHGSRQQFEDPNKLRHEIKFVVKDIDEICGGNNWLAMYGGEPYIEETPTIAHIMKILYEEHGKKILMVQNKYYGRDIHAPKKPSHFGHMSHGAAYLYEDEYDIDNVGRRALLFGGFRVKHGQKEYVGASKVWFSKEITDTGKFAGQVCFGGGPIAVEKAQICQDEKIPLFYVRSPVKSMPDDGMVPSISDKWGAIDVWMKNQNIPNEHWHPDRPNYDP